MGMGILEDNHLRVGNGCNNNCLICDQLQKKAKNNLSTQDILSFLSTSPHTIIFPCNTDIRKDIWILLAEAKKAGKRVILETNGRMFSNQGFISRIRGLVDQIILIGLGSDAATHQEITRTPVAFRQAEAGRNALMQSGIDVVYRDISNHLRIPAEIAVPIEVVIELTADCNFDCGACFNKTTFAANERGKGGMTTGFIIEIIDAISAAGIPRIRFSGGEPLLRDDLLGLMAYADSKGLEVWLNTNASLIDKGIAKELERYATNVLVAFNGWDEESDYCWSRTTGSFNDKIRGVKELMRTAIPVIRCGTVATPQNIAHFGEIHALIDSLGIRSWELWRPIPLKPAENGIDVLELVGKILRLRMDHGKNVLIANSIPFCSIDPRVMSLVAAGALWDDGHSRYIVDPTGYAKPSYFLSLDLGDPRKPLDVWNHPYMKTMRSHGFAPKSCENCPYLMRCKGGSRYIGNLETGEMSGEDPLMDRGNVLYG